MSMNKSITDTVEEILESITSKQIPVLVDLFGQSCLIHRPRSAEIASKAYGTYSQDNIGLENPDMFITFENRVLTTLHGFVESGALSSLGLYEQDPEYAYSKGDVRVGDVVQVKRRDGGRYFLKVTDAQRIGVSVDILWRLKVTNYEN